MTGLSILILAVMLFALRSSVVKLRDRVDRMENRLDSHQTVLGSMTHPSRREAPSAQPDKPFNEESRPKPPPKPVAEKPNPQRATYYGPPKQATDTSEAKPASVPAAARKPAPKQTKAFDDMEQDLSTKWMMWVGGLALALGGGFLVKYSIDAGLLHPAIRVSLGTLFGLVLAIGGEIVRRRRGSIKWLGDTPDYLPGALSAAGLFTLFASIYGAYGLYDLLSPMVTFGALALVSVGASYLALTQGRFFGYLGLIGGMVVPALVSTGNANAWALFPYLLFVVATTLWVARRHTWADIAVSGLSLASLWVILWIFTNWHTADIVPVGLYLLTLGGLNAWMMRGASPARSTDAKIYGLLPSHGVSAMSDGVSLLIFVLLASLVRLDHYGAMSLSWFAIAFAGQAFAVFKDGEHDLAAVGALGASLFLLVTWHVPDLFELQEMLHANEAMHFALSPIAAPGFAKFVTAGTLLAGFVGFGAYFMLPRLLRKPMWASLGTAYPIMVLLITYGRLNDFETSVPFAAIAAGMAGLFTLAVAGLNRKGDKTWDIPVAAYASGATLALALALAFALRDAWLSFALALEVVALGYIWRKMKIEGLRHLALGLASVVLVRLLLNPAVFGYAGTGPLPVINWLFYGYGLTAGLFAYAAHLFERDLKEDKLVSVLKAGGAMLAIAFTTLEIRVLASKTGSLLGDFTAMEAALQTINWSAAATILFLRETHDNNVLFGYMRRLMTVVSLFGLFVAGGITNNIFFQRINVGEWPIMNLQLLQFLVPSILYAFKARIADIAGRERSQTLYGSVALLGLFVWITLEVRHLFYPSGGVGAPSDWEWYGYSFAWLLYAVGLLFSGIKLEEKRLRQAGLGVLAIVVVKVFLMDMNHLEGIARALSFMGLGAALIGLGYLYQFFRREDRGDENSDDRSNQFTL